MNVVDEIVASVADFIASQEDREFLHARLAFHEVPAGIWAIAAGVFGRRRTSCLPAAASSLRPDRHDPLTDACRVQLGAPEECQG
jgi:hypothetical protein